MKNILTIDVEDWFNVCGVESIGDHTSWARFEPRVKENLMRILDIFTEYNVKATFFILGWVAERYPEIIAEIDRRGHEIATHGYAHKLVYEQTAKEFTADLEKSLQILGQITKQKILGFRAASFSITKDALWALPIIAEHGLQYDSSIFPTKRAEGGLPGAKAFPYEINLQNGKTLWEFPVSMMNIFKFRLGYSGGGYFRLLPYSLIKKQIQKTNRDNHPALVYLHPREIDPHQPRLNMSWKKSFKYYVNIKHTEEKLKKLLKDFEFCRCSAVLNLRYSG